MIILLSTNKPKKLMRIDDVADVLDITESRAYDLARQGILPSVRLGRQIRVDRDALENWIARGGQALPGGWRREE
ncbi:MAG: helix-turn-helix domain-containing protein [Syntrophomonadaceae bacterium]|nr:helix-turn-helix domain-containing protein [Syntrophomonadaceae bacterium]